MMSTVLRHLREEKAVYLPLLIELVFCFAFLSYSYTHFVAGEQANRAMSEEIGAWDIQIAEEPGRSTDTSFTLKTEEIDALSDMTRGGFSYSVDVAHAFFGESAVVDFRLLFSNRYDPGERAVIMLPKLKEELSKKGQFTIPGMEIKGDTLVFQGQKYEIRPLPPEMRGRTLFSDEYGRGIAAEQTIFFSFRGAAYQEMTKPEQYGSLQGHIALKSEELKKDPTLLPRLLQVLDKAANGEMNFRPENITENTTRINQYVVMIPGYLGKIGVVLALLATVGVATILQIVLRKREKEQAIMIAMGEPLGMLLGEMIVEIVLLIGGGVLIGVGLGALALKIYAFQEMFPVVFTMQAFVPVVLVAGSMLILSILVSVVRILRLTPHQILSSL